MKTAYIMRGLPGSGKSTVARQIAENRLSTIHSTDNFFMVNGEYQFNPSKLREYHAKNLAAFTKSCEDNTPVVICDNTNTQEWEYEQYIKAAEENGYCVAIVKMKHPSTIVAAERNTHGVPLEAILRMLSRFED